MQLPPDDELELIGELPKPPRRRVERLVDEQRRLRHEEQLAKARRTRLAQIQLEQAEREAAERQQAEAEAQAIPTDPEFAAWLEGRHRGGRGVSSTDATYDSDAALSSTDFEAESYEEEEDEANPLEPPLSEEELHSQSGTRTRRDWGQDASTTTPDKSGPVALDSKTAPVSHGAVASTTVTGQRKAKSRLRRTLRRVTAVCVLAGMAGGGYLFFSSPRFNVRSVPVKGQNITSPSAVQKAQALLIGHNWARARTGEAQKMLETLPTVRKAEVSRVLTWPPQLSIQLYERQPFVRMGEGRNWWVVDVTGVPFRRVDDQDAADRALLPLTGPELTPHEGKALPNNLWHGAVKLATILQNDGGTTSGVADADATGNAGWNLRRVYFDRSGAVSLRLAGGSQDGLLVRLGNEGWAHKLTLARQALTFFEATGRHAATLDLASPDLPSLVSLNRAIWTERAPQSEANKPSEERTSRSDENRTD